MSRMQVMDYIKYHEIDFSKYEGGPIVCWVTRANSAVILRAQIIRANPFYAYLSLDPNSPILSWGCPRPLKIIILPLHKKKETLNVKIVALTNKNTSCLVQIQWVKWIPENIRFLLKI